MATGVSVHRLSPKMADEYIDFFDKRAFSDGSAEKGCYCVWHHWTEKHERERSLLPENERPFCKKNYAKELIKNGALNGFAAFCDDKIVGFCNADLKNNYFRLSKENQPNSWKGTNESDKILAVVCFIVAPDMRRKGIAKALLDCACQYVKENGFDYIEGYPPKENFSVKDCGGSVSMFESRGFEIIDIPGGVIARKNLKRG